MLPLARAFSEESLPKLAKPCADRSKQGALAGSRSPLGRRDACGLFDRILELVGKALGQLRQQRATHGFPHWRHRATAFHAYVEHDLGPAVAEGHSAGADKLEEVLDWCEEADIDVVSVWGLSVDNLSRGPEELEGLMRLFEARLMDLVDSERIHRNRVQVRVVGRRELLPEHVRQAAERAERATAHHRRRTLNICLAYGGREEIVDALRAWHQAAVAAGADPAEAVARLEPDDLSPYLSTAPAPNPDLIIRTSGEVRLSGFLLWQSAQAEFYFCDTYWPAFRKIDFLRALRSYDQRHRRFGR